MILQKDKEIKYFIFLGYKICRFNSLTNLYEIEIALYNLNKISSEIIIKPLIISFKDKFPHSFFFVVGRGDGVRG